MRKTSTAGNNSTERHISIIVPAMTLLLAVGTGGDNSPDYYKLRGAKLVVNQSRFSDSSGQTINVASAADDLSRIKSVLKLSTTDIAQSLGVSRQAIYNWKSGSHIKSHNLQKLENFKRAADTVASARLTMSPLWLDRKLSGGKTLLEKIASGEDGAEAAGSLIAMLQRETQQREALDKLLSDRTPEVREASDYGAPAFNES